MKDYLKKDMPKCPICGAKPYIRKDIVDEFYFGWSVGCPRYCLDDGIHGITAETPKYLHLSRFYLNSKEECIKAWLGIVVSYEIIETERRMFPTIMSGSRKVGRYGRVCRSNETKGKNDKKL